MGQPEGVELMGQREDAMGMVTGEQPRLLERQPALGLEIRALRARPVATPIVPDARHMTLRTGLDMAAKRGGATLHEGGGGSAPVGGEGMALLIGRKRVLEDRLERDERHRCLRTRGRRRASGCFLQYHAYYPRDKRLVQTGVSGKKPGRARLPLRLSGPFCSCSYLRLPALAQRKPRVLPRPPRKKRPSCGL